jgi:DNA-binding SARP family transcriptional activator
VIPPGIDHATLLTVKLLGGFRIGRDGGLDECQWPRRSAKTLIKVLSTWPGHSLHREQLIEMLWPGAEADSALNSLAKALHAARRSLEPDLEPRANSAYLSLTDAMVTLRTEHVLIDADAFEQLAQEARRRTDLASYEAAVAAYQGDLLPEDRYEDWCAQRRVYLAELHIRLMLEFADLLRQKGSWNESAEQLREILKVDPTREDVHRCLMRMYAEMGTPDQAVRQFLLCQDVLRRKLDVAPQPETTSLYEDVLASRIVADPPPELVAISPASASPASASPASASPEASVARKTAQPQTAPFVGREQLIQNLWDHLARGGGQKAGMVLIGGDNGVGKTRLLDEFAGRATELGATILWGGRTTQGSELARSTFAVALERYAAGLSASDRAELGRRYPALAHFVPSIGIDQRPPASDPGRYRLELSADVVRLLTDLGRSQPLVIVLGDLHRLDTFSLDLLPYLAQLAPPRSWLITATVRDGEIEPGTAMWRMLDTMLRERVCTKVELRCLSRRSSDELVRALHGTATPSEATLEQIFSATRGNPSLIKAMVSELVHCPPPHRPGPTADRDCCAHSRVRAITAKWTVSIDETARRVLGLAAAAESAVVSTAEFRLAAAALDPPISAPALFDALDRLFRMRAIEERDNGYACRYPIVRAALWDDLPLHRREQLRAALRAAQYPSDRDAIGRVMPEPASAKATRAGAVPECLRPRYQAADRRTPSRRVVAGL